VQFTAEVVAYETDNSSIGEIICERATDTDAAAVIMAGLYSRTRIHFRVMTLSLKPHAFQPLKLIN
jgi:hypothetical protein